MNNLAKKLRAWSDDARSGRDIGGVDYYVVEGSLGRFYTLDAAKEIASYRSERKLK